MTPAGRNKKLIRSRLKNAGFTAVEGITEMLESTTTGGEIRVAFLSLGTVVVLVRTYMPGSGLDYSPWLEVFRVPLNEVKALPEEMAIWKRRIKKKL